MPEWLISIVDQIDWSQFGTWGIIIGAVVTLLRKQIAKAVPVVASVVKTDPDVLDLGAVKRLEERALRRKCPKLVEAVRSVESCFFNRAAETKKAE